jgi:hypothetical protein
VQGFMSTETQPTLAAASINCAVVYPVTAITGMRRVESQYLRSRQTMRTPATGGLMSAMITGTVDATRIEVANGLGFGEGWNRPGRGRGAGLRKAPASISRLRDSHWHSVRAREASSRGKAWATYGSSPRSVESRRSIARSRKWAAQQCGVVWELRKGERTRAARSSILKKRPAQARIDALPHARNTVAQRVLDRDNGAWRHRRLERLVIGSNVWAIAGTASQSFAGRFCARNCGFAAHACSEGGRILHGF